MPQNATVVIILVLLTLMLSGFSPPPQSTEIECDQRYIVQANDWLSKIAEKYFGDMQAYTVIVDAANAHANDTYTDIVDPNLIEPGWVLCIPSEEDVTRLMATNTIPPGLSLPELANTSYSSQWTADGTAPLTKGEYNQGNTKVVMLTERTSYGRLNGKTGAAVVLVTDPGDGSAFVTLHIMTSQDNQPAEFSHILLGNRVQVNAIGIRDNQIVIDMVQVGPHDPPCCPTQQVLKTFALQKEQLVETSSQIAGPPSIEAIGIIWKWLSFSDFTAKNNLTVPNPDTFRLELLPDGTFRAKADCNKVSGTYTLNDTDLTLKIGPSTMTACGSNSLYNEYLSLLRQVAGLEYNNSNLILKLADDESSMNFSQLHAVTGTVIGPANATLPTGAMLEVKVMDMSELPGTQMGGVLQEITTFPVDFEAIYNHQAVVTGNVYELEVTIKDAKDNLHYQNTQANRVLTQGYPTYKVMVMVGAVKE